MELSTKYKDKKFFITSVTENYVLGTYDKDKKTGIFKVDLSELKWTKAQSTYISKLNSKN